MLGPAGRVQTAASASLSDGAALGGRVALPWRALLAALMVLALGAALYGGLSGGRSALRPIAVRTRGISHESLLSLPLAAQGPVSATLGSNSPAYRVRAYGDGFRASSPAQRLSSSFLTSGVSVTSGATHVRLSLRGVGYGSSLAALAAVAPKAHGNRVDYVRPGLSEWYANGPAGLEQGFTLARAPTRHAPGPLTLSIALSGNAQASLAKDGQSVTLSRAGKTVLRYTGLSATDARGHVLRSWLVLAGGRLLLRLDANGARYPLRIDPFVQQGGKLTDGLSGYSFGYSVALSADGDTALIGGGTAAWVFTRTGSTWTEQEKLTGRGEIVNDSCFCNFGSSVALSADGNTALIGAYGNNSSVGAVWVFTRSSFGSPYDEQEKLTGGGEIGDGAFGKAVVLSADGNTALIGAYENDSVGAAWVFTRSSFGSAYDEQEKLKGGDETGAGWFGLSVALSSDGNTALIGGPERNGAVWVFTRSGFGSPYDEQERLGGGAPYGGGFGISVALSSNGNTALIGASIANGFAGAAWVFTRPSFGSSYAEQQELTGAGEIGDGSFGWSVALSSDGNTALIGGDYDNDRVGAAWAFTRSGSTWSPLGSKLTGSGETGQGEFGFSVALSSAGNTALIGGYFDNSLTGAVWVFETLPTVTTGSASEVMPTSATLSATVNPNGEEVTECEFEYGTTVSYGSSVPCSPSAGSGTSAVAVSAPLSDLDPNETYHYRIVATNADGTREGSDKTFTTLFNSASGISNGIEASASVGPQLSATATGSSGSVTVGQYGSDPAGPPPFVSSGEYIDVYLSAGNSFSKLEFQDCELNGGNSVDWWNPQANNGNGQWQAVSDETAPSGVPPCITVTITDTTSPDLVQMTETMFGIAVAPSPTVVTKAASSVTQTSATLNATVNPNGAPVNECKLEYGPTVSYGKSQPCSSSPGSGGSPVAVSASITGLTANTTYHFRISATNGGGTSEGSDETFTTLAALEYGTCGKVGKTQPQQYEEEKVTQRGTEFKKKETKVYSGEYEDKNCTKPAPEPGPVGTEAPPKRIRTSYKGPEGKYEWVPTPEDSQIKITDKTTTVTLKSALVSVVCKKSTSEGEITGPTADTETVTYTGCKASAVTCTSAGQPAGSIKTNPLDSSLIAEHGEVRTRYESSAPPYLAEFACAATSYRVKGSVAAVDSCDVNVMATKGCEAFAEGMGEQLLELEVVGGASEPATEIATATSKSATKIEIKTFS